MIFFFKYRNISPYVIMFDSTDLGRGYPFTVVYKYTGGGGESYFDVILVLHIISYKIITNVGIYTKFSPACLRRLVQCLK